MDNPVEEIKARLNVQDVLSSYINLIPAGIGNFKALCPFHNEKTPSFMVSAEKQIWKCFGCGKGGDIFSFVMEMEGVEFKEALRILAGKAGVVLKKQDHALASKRNGILDCLEAASRFFFQVLLNAPQAKNARDYLDKRKIDGEMIDNFKIGYAPDSWDALYKALRKKGFYDKDIEDSGLIIQKSQGKNYYDRFRNRIMFPIRDINGNVVGFSGRTLDKDDAGAKYINTPQTAVFDKSRTIFALEKAKQEIKKKDLAVIVEGQMDVISSHQAGMKNVVATSGTALTAEHIKIIKRYTDNIALAFDRDEAGKNAAKRAVELSLQADMNIKVIRIPEGKDPDECIKNNPKDWENAIANAENFLDYYFDEVLSKVNLEKAQDKKQAAKILLEMMAKIINKVEQEHYVQKLSNNLNIPEAVLREVLGKVKKTPLPVTKFALKKEVVFKKKDKNLQIAERIIAFGLLYFENFSHIAERLLPEYIKDKRLNHVYKQLIIYYNKYYKKGASFSKKFDESLFVELIDSPQDENIAEYLKELWLFGEKELLEYKESGEVMNPQRIKMEIQSGIARLREDYNKTRLSELQIKIQEAERLNKQEIIEQLSKEVNRIMREIAK